MKAQFDSCARTIENYWDTVVIFDSLDSFNTHTSLLLSTSFVCFEHMPQMQPEHV